MISLIQNKMNNFSLSLLVFVCCFIVAYGKHIYNADSEEKHGTMERNGIIDSKKYWPGGVVPIHINMDNFTKYDIQIIRNALKEIESKTCIKFREKMESDVSFVNILGAPSGCWSFVGMQSKPQDLNLNPDGCMSNNIVIHEMLHALGFMHQQSAFNRDEYVTINWDNIVKQFQYAFAIQKDTTDFGVGYEYGSVMHYGKYYFAINSSIATIYPLEQNAVLGGTVFTEKDILKVRKMYKC